MLNFYFVWVVLGCILGIIFFASVCFVFFMLGMYFLERMKWHKSYLIWHHTDTVLLVISLITALTSGFVLSLITAALLD